MLGQLSNLIPAFSTDMYPVTLGEPGEEVTYLLSWLHLSDIHVGHGDQQNQADQDVTLQEIVEDAQHQIGDFLPRRPDLLIVTGDIANKGGANKGEYDYAAKWLSGLANAAGINSAAVFVVPGNHDVNR